MSEFARLGVLYTEHSNLRERTLLASLWSYQTQPRGPVRRPVVRNGDGNYEYWLERTDPLLNRILPGTCVSLVVNFGEAWASGRSLATSALLPKVFVVGPVTRPLILQVGMQVEAIGAVFSSTETDRVVGVRASDLVDRIVPLEDLWSRQEVDAVVDSIWALHPRHRVSELCRVLISRDDRPRSPRIEDITSRLITLRHGSVSINQMAKSHGISRKQFASRFCAVAGMPPKLYARITRFQTLVRALLCADVSQWASVASTVGFYDQAHMINEFRGFAGAPPTVFFQPYGDTISSGTLQRRGRPSEWVRTTNNVA